MSPKRILPRSLSAYLSIVTNSVLSYAPDPPDPPSNHEAAVHAFSISQYDRLCPRYILQELSGHHMVSLLPGIAALIDGTLGINRMAGNARAPSVILDSHLGRMRNGLSIQ